MREEGAEVVIVGAGPVGLCLAMDLALRGVQVVVAEARHRGEPPSVKCNHVSARSMEILRRLGVAQRVRDAGLPPDYPHDVAYRTATVGIELARIRIPCRRDRFRVTDGPDGGWPTPEPPHRINQIFLEPLLFEHAAAMDRIRILSRTEVGDVRQDGDGVSAEATDLERGERLVLRGRYLVGCDGGRSGVRRQIGAQLEGDPIVQRVQSTYIRAPALLGLLRDPPAWGTFSLNPRRSGNVYAIDGIERWLVHNYLNDDEEGFESVDRDASLRAILGVDETFEYEVISREDWFGRRLVADRFRDRRIFICGDSAHIWVPFAGYGMNAGIADAANLAWLLAAHLRGWGAGAILDAYEAERQPITEQVSRFAMQHAAGVHRQRAAVPEEIERDDAEGERVRAEVGRAAYELNVAQYAAAGLNFGYFYDRSPIIAYDGATAPGYTMRDFESSTVPGCRVPHVWQRDGRSLYDDLGDRYTLLVVDPDADPAPLLRAARRRAIPLDALRVDAEDAAGVYGRKLVLSRPDLHVAWRGDELPADVDALLDRIVGLVPAGERAPVAPAAARA